MSDLVISGRAVFFDESGNQSVVNLSPAVSPRALAIAREIDRLVPGDYNIRIEKRTAAEGGGLYFELAQQMTIRARELK